MGLEFPKIPTMISKEERTYLYNLASKDWKGQGIIVEIGPWLGGSTYCLASGLRDSTHNGYKKLFVFDNFIWREFMNVRSGQNLRDGESFYSEFLKNTNTLSDYISSFQASLPDEKVVNDSYADQRRQSYHETKILIENPSSDPIEILFIDGAKSWTGMKYLISKFYPFFIPNSTLLVCQDYKYWGMYWVVMIIELLIEKLEITHILKSNTVSFRLVQKLNDSDIEKIPDFDGISVPDGLRLLKSASARLLQCGDIFGAKIIELCAIRFLTHKDRVAEAIDQLIILEKNWPLLLKDSQLLQTKRWLIEQSKTDIRDTFKTRFRKIVLNFNRMLKRIGIR